MDPLDVFSPRTREWFERAFAGPHAGAGARLAGDREGRPRPRAGADRLREDARRVPHRHRPAERDARRRAPSPLRLAAQGAELRHRAEPSPPARGARIEAVGGRSHRRHAGRRAPPDAQDAARRPHHDSRVALPAPDLTGAREPARDRGRDPRRGARGRGNEAWRSPRPIARTAREARREAVPADRALGHAEAARRDRPLRRRHRSRDRARGRGRAQGARPRGRRPGRGHARAAIHLRALRADARGRRRDGRRRRAVESFDLALDLPGDPRPRPVAPLDDRLRQQPQARRAPRVAHQRARRRGACSCSSPGRSHASNALSSRSC